MWHDVRPLLGFGAWYSLSQLGNWFALNNDNLISVRLLGTEALGVYNQAYMLMARPADVIGSAVDKVLFPAMARVREDGERLRNAYVRSVSLIALITIPIAVFVGVLAPEIIHILLGPKWLGVVLPLQVLSLALLPRASYKVSGSLTRATGDVSGGAWRQWLYAGEVVVACGIGARFGITGVAAGATVAIYLHFLVMLHFSGRVASGLARSVLVMYLKHLPVAVVSFGAAESVALLMRPLGWSVVTVLTASAAWGVATLVTIYAMRGFFDEELDVLLSFGVVRKLAAKVPSPGKPIVARRAS
jgi:PST family polysaccharide transporter